MPSSGSICRRASTPMSAASRPTITTSSALAADGPPRSTTRGCARSSARSPGRPATASRTTASSCSVCVRPAWPPGRVPTSIRPDRRDDLPVARPTRIETRSHSVRDAVLASCLAGGRLRRRQRASGVLGTSASNGGRRRRPSSPTSSATSAVTASRSSRSSRPASGRRTTSRSPTTRKKLAGADLIVSNGVGLDDFLDKLITAAGEGAAKRLVLGDGIPTITWTVSRTRISGSTRASWRPTTSPPSPRPCPRWIPAGAATYAANAAAFTAQLDALDAANMAKIATIPAAEPQARDVPRRVPVLRRALRFRAGRGDPPERRPGAERGRPRRARREGQGGQRQGGLLGGPVQPGAGPDPGRGGRRHDRS